MSYEILLIGSDESLCREITDYLQSNGYEMVGIIDNRFALETVQSTNPDLILVSRSLADGDIFQACRQLREKTISPIILLSNSGYKADVVAALESGVDDYMLAPFSLRELLARIRAKMRQTQRIHRDLLAEQAGEIRSTSFVHNPTLLTFDTMTIDIKRHAVQLREKWLHLKPREYELLLFLARNPDIPVSRKEIQHHVWRGENVKERTINTHVCKLRAKIERDPRQLGRITTIHRYGYQFNS